MLDKNKQGALAAQAHLMDALADFGYSVPQSSMGMNVALAVEVLQQIGHRLVGTWVSRQLVRHRASAALTEEAARTYFSLFVLSLSTLGSPSPAACLCFLRALNMSESSPSPSRQVLATCYASMAFLLTFRVPHRKLLTAFWFHAADVYRKLAATTESSYQGDADTNTGLMQLVDGWGSVGFGDMRVAVEKFRSSANLYAESGLVFMSWESKVGLMAVPRSVAAVVEVVGR